MEIKKILPKDENLTGCTKIHARRDLENGDYIKAVCTRILIEPEKDNVQIDYVYTKYDSQNRPIAKSETSKPSTLSFYRVENHAAYEVYEVDEDGNETLIETVEAVNSLDKYNELLEPIIVPVITFELEQILLNL